MLPCWFSWVGVALPAQQESYCTLCSHGFVVQAFKKLAKYLELGSVYELLKNEKLVKIGTKIFKYLGGWAQDGRNWLLLQLT